MYEPRRTEHYDYVYELIEDIERWQCGDCMFNTGDLAMPMCWEIAGNATLERPIEEWSEDEDGRVWCNKYESTAAADVRQKESRDSDSLRLA